MKKQIRSLKKTLQFMFLLIIGIMIIPTIYSIIALQIYTQRYDEIVSNVGQANKISLIAKNDIPNELWEIVCGKKSFMKGEQYVMIHNIFSGIEEMQARTDSNENKEKLKVAYRACSTLSRNVIMLDEQIEKGCSVTENENLLDEIRTITSLFSDIIHDYIISEIESANITNSAIKRTSITLTILQGAIILLSLIIASYFYFSSTHDLETSLSDMKKLSAEIAQGNLSARVASPSITEFVPLSNNMNLMAEQIDLLIKKNIEEQQNFQKAEMKALQAQITPHFLYNTFDTIIWLAEQEDTERVVKITKAFSEFLRISLSKGHEWITIQQELDHISNYLTIQKTRYADILNYEFFINQELVNFKIIKLVLQPLIENAIYHGIKNKRGRGNIKISVDFLDETKESIIFTVIDNGAGFTEERLLAVRNELTFSANDSERLTTVYGLYNVNKKLKLYYGNKTQGLKIESELNKGTKISFIIPCLTGDENV